MRTRFKIIVNAKMVIIQKDVILIETMNAQVLFSF